MSVKLCFTVTLLDSTTPASCCINTACSPQSRWRLGGATRRYQRFSRGGRRQKVKYLYNIYICLVGSVKSKAYALTVICSSSKYHTWTLQLYQRWKTDLLLFLTLSFWAAAVAWAKIIMLGTLNDLKSEQLGEQVNPVGRWKTAEGRQLNKVRCMISISVWGR